MDAKPGRQDLLQDFLPVFTFSLQSQTHLANERRERSHMFFSVMRFGLLEIFSALN